MEVEVFDEKNVEENGGSLILQHVARPSYTETETRAAHQLAERLGGLPLALVVMASYIRNRRFTISDFVQFYEAYAKELNSEVRGIESYYKLSLATCWRTAFDSLGPEAKHLLGIIAHLGPQALPESLFHPADASKLPPGMKFSSNRLKYEYWHDQNPLADWLTNRQVHRSSWRAVGRLARSKRAQ